MISSSSNGTLPPSGGLFGHARNTASALGPLPSIAHRRCCSSPPPPVGQSWLAIALWSVLVAEVTQGIVSLACSSVGPSGASGWTVLKLKKLPDEKGDHALIRRACTGKASAKGDEP